MKLWDILKETCLTTFTGKMGGINCISLCPDEVTNSTDNKIIHASQNCMHTGMQCMLKTLEY